MLLNQVTDGDALVLRPRVAIFAQAAAAVFAAKSKREMLVIRLEVTRVAIDYLAEGPAAGLTEFMIRLAVRQRVPIEIG